MEDFLWMLKQAAVPIIVGFLMVLPLSPWTSWRPRTKLRTGFWYQILLLGVMFGEPFVRYSWRVELSYTAAQIYGCVIAAFAIGIAMSMLRHSEGWFHRIGGGFFLALYGSQIVLRFAAELLDAGQSVVNWF